MEFFVNLPQPFLVNMCVNLGSGNVGMAEHFLHTSQIRSTS
jgi:hypothetical protein